jgi:HTH-type transcriptional regulator / antitoxin HigA
MDARIPAEVFPPGEFLRDELESRNWTQIEFAEIIGKDTRLVYEIINGKRAVTPETAIIFGEALGTSPELWLNLESQYQLSKVRSKQSTVSRKAQLHTKFPVREMIKRGWIEATDSIDLLESQLFNFFGMKDTNDKPSFVHAAKKQSYKDAPIQQIAWLCRARKIAFSAPAQKYSVANLSKAMDDLKSELEYVEGIRNVASILAKAGIRFVIVEPLAGSKIDGACFWLDNKSPVVVLSLRYDRIDNFWHTLLHELDHVKHGEGMEQPVIDIDILDTTGNGKPAMEIRASETAAENLIPANEMTGFIARVNPMFSDDLIVGFAKRIHVHPGIVVGQLQNRGLIHWSFYRKRLEKIRDVVIATAITDGYGQLINDLRDE